MPSLPPQAGVEVVPFSRLEAQVYLLFFIAVEHVCDVMHVPIFFSSGKL